MASEKTRLLPAYKSHVAKGGLYRNTKSKECIVVIQRNSSITADSSDNEGFYGLSLEELLPYQNDPLWMNVRLAIMILFWAAMIVMLTITFMISAVESQEGCGRNVSKTMLTSILSSNIVPNIVAPILDTRNTVLST